LKALVNLCHTADQTNYPSGVLFAAFWAVLCSQVTSWSIAGGLAHFSALLSCFTGIAKGAEDLQNKIKQNKKLLGVIRTEL